MAGIAELRMIMSMEYENFALENFEGPLDFLLHLVSKSEIDIHDVALQELTTQFLDKLEQARPSIERGAEFIGTTAFLMWLKSKMLLPRHEQLDIGEEELDPHFEIIHQLMEYCRFKDAAKELVTRDQQQREHFPRGVFDPPPEMQKRAGVEHLSPEDLAQLFQNALKRLCTESGRIHEEEWKVSDKIMLVRDLLKKQESARIDQLFSCNMSRLELIVTFLAMLELMKMGDIVVVQQENGIMVKKHV